MHNYLIVGDPHCKPSNLKETSEFLYAIKDYSIRNNLRLVLLGDLFDTHAVIRSEVLGFWHQYFQDFFEIKPIVLIGNHSMSNQVIPARMADAPEKILPNIIYIDRATTIDGIGYVPYAHTKEMFFEELKEFDKVPNILMCHQEFKGFKYETGISTNEQSADIEDLRQFKLVISGHIHAHQIKHHIVYVGAPYHLRKSDHANPKHVMLLNSTTLKYEFLNDFAHLGPTVQYSEPKRKENSIRKTETMNLSLDDLLLKIVNERFQDESYRRGILAKARECLRIAS